MATLDQSASAARQLAAARFRLATALPGRQKLYANEAAFLATEFPNLGETLAEYAKERRAVVLVCPDGEERLLAPEPPDLSVG
jgi:hypothetical protein